jgi:hypothetical protein
MPFRQKSEWIGPTLPCFTPLCVVATHTYSLIHTTSACQDQYFHSSQRPLEWHHGVNEGDQRSTFLSNGKRKYENPPARRHHHGRAPCQNRGRMLLRRRCSKLHLSLAVLENRNVVYDDCGDECALPIKISKVLLRLYLYQHQQWKKRHIRSVLP